MEENKVLAYMVNKHGKPYNIIRWVDTRTRLKRWQRQKLKPEPAAFTPGPVSRYVKELYREMFKNWQKY